MAKPIKPTPTLTGKDAIAFYSKKNAVETSARNDREREKLQYAFKSISLDKPKSKD